MERHIRQFLAASRDGMPMRDIYDQVIAEVERPLIQMTLSATRGNQIKAAAMLGLNRNTLRKKIRTSTSRSCAGSADARRRRRPA